MAESGRRRWLIAATVLMLLGVGTWWIDRQLQPQQLTATVLREAGASLGLELSIDGLPDYALRPEPRLRLPRLTVRVPGSTHPLLRAELAEVSLPWSTLVDRDASLVITRLELDSPDLDLPALQAWLASRPATPFEWPTFSQGLVVRAGRVHGGDWSLQDVTVRLPLLAPNQPASLQLSGKWIKGDDQVGFSGQLDADAVGARSAIALRVAGHWQHEQRRLPYQLALKGRAEYLDNSFDLHADALSLDSESPLPDFTGKAALSLGESLSVNVAGELPSWPSDWPALPAPISLSTSPMSLTIAYQGTQDFSGVTTVVVVRDQTRAQAELHIPELQAWLAASEAQPLPPMKLTAQTPRLEFDGTVLEDVRIEISDAAAPEP